MLKKLVFLLWICTSCNTTSIISTAINHGQEISIRVERHGDAWTDPMAFYTATAKKNGEVYELHLTKGDTTVIYQLPPNKLILLSQMENSFKDLSNNISLSYHQLIIQVNKKKKLYKINTDVVNDFITGLKK